APDHGGEKHCYAERHGQGVKLREPILNRAKERTKQTRNLAHDIHQPVDDIQIDHPAKLREPDDGLHDEKAIKLIEIKLVERKLVEPWHTFSETGTEIGLPDID